VDAKNSFRIIVTALALGLVACGGEVAAPTAAAEGAVSAAKPAEAVQSTRLLPEGGYACSLWSGGMLMVMGMIEVKDGRYRGPGFDGKYPGGWHAYDLSPDGAVIWTGKLGALDTDGNQVVSSVLTTGDSGQTFIRVLVKTDTGSTQTADCRLSG
jgi:hypothetical protein